jgi:hypothetical protein
MRIAALLRRLQGTIDPTDGLGDALGDNGMRRQWRLSRAAAAATSFP